MIGLQTKTVLAKNLGLSFDEIIKLSHTDEIKFVEARIGKPLDFSHKQDSRKLGRGNPLLARKRIKTMSEINKRLDSLSV
jgi:hypothetical protein